MADPYAPKPIDTSQVALNDEIRQVVEQLAENVHDRWAAQRIADGWRLGPTRDDSKKTHPSLIPYKNLPEEEKEYDRQTALTTIQALLAIGFQIERKV